MEISHREFKHCDLIKITGRLDSSTAPQLNEKITSLMDEGRYRMVLDLSSLDFISSAGLRVLVNAQKTCKRYNRGEIVFACVPSNIYASLDLVGFTILFKMFDDVLVAVGSF